MPNAKEIYMWDDNGTTRYGVAWFQRWTTPNHWRLSVINPPDGRTNHVTYDENIHKLAPPDDIIHLKMKVIDIVEGADWEVGVRVADDRDYEIDEMYIHHWDIDRVFNEIVTSIELWHKEKGNPIIDIVSNTIKNSLVE